MSLYWSASKWVLLLCKSNILYCMLLKDSQNFLKLLDKRHEFQHCNFPNLKFNIKYALHRQHTQDFVVRQTYKWKCMFASFFYLHHMPWFRLFFAGVLSHCAWIIVYINTTLDMIKPHLGCWIKYRKTDHVQW